MGGGGTSVQAGLSVHGTVGASQSVGNGGTANSYSGWNMDGWMEFEEQRVMSGWTGETGRSQG